MHAQDLSIVADTGGRSHSVAISATSARSNVINANYALVTLTVPGFMRQGVDPTATNDGTDIYLVSDITYRVNIAPGSQLAFRTAGLAGVAYVTPGG